MTAGWEPFRESLRATVVRNLLIAVVAGTVLAAWSARAGRPVLWPVAVVLMLWPSFGGHGLELWYLNWLRPRLTSARAVHAAARVGTWFLGGCGIGLGMILTARVFGLHLTQRPAWWLAGVVFIGVELVAHAMLHARAQPSFFNGRG